MLFCSCKSFSAPAVLGWSLNRIETPVFLHVHDLTWSVSRYGSLFSVRKKVETINDTPWWIHSLETWESAEQTLADVEFGAEFFSPRTKHVKVKSCILFSFFWVIYRLVQSFYNVCIFVLLLFNPSILWWVLLFFFSLEITVFFVPLSCLVLFLDSPTDRQYVDFVVKKHQVPLLRRLRLCAIASKSGPQHCVVGLHLPYRLTLCNFIQGV